ncbi:MAG: hypothetical protein ABJE66_25045 [Deltaproteobacteria bacterium]
MRSIILAAALWSCGKDGAPAAKAKPSAAVKAGTAGPAGAKKPCEYVMRSDAEAALGMPLPGTTETEVTGECIYHTPEFYGVTVAIGTWEGVLLSANGGGASHPPLAVAGIGDEAVHNGSHLYVRKGERGLMVSLNGPTVDADEGKAVAQAMVLARKILPNL